jgi:pentatricopeptide repeat protein
LQHTCSNALPQLAVMTKLIATAARKGDWAKGLFVFQCLPQLGLQPDTTATNAALSACMRGGNCVQARDILFSMETRGVAPSATTFRIAVTAMGRGGDWHSTALVRLLSSVATCGSCRGHWRDY